MRRILTLSLLAVFVLTFAVGGCSEKDCKDLKAQLDSLRLQIYDIIQQRMKVDAEGKDMGKAMELHQQEVNLRNQYGTTSDQYKAAGCEGETGEVPSLPPMNPITETPY